MDIPANYHDMHWTDRRKVREEYTKIQGGNCYHCGYQLTGEPAPEVKSKQVNENLFPTGFFKWPVHLHHSHETGMTLGAVHSYCNAVLWQYHGE